MTNRRKASLFSIAIVLTATVDAQAGEPCCTVLSVDGRGTVTAFERKSGNIFSFSVKNKAQLAAFQPCQEFDANLGELKSGQAFAADLGATNRAQVKSGEPCCQVRSAPGSAGRVLGVQPHGKFDGVEVLLVDLKRTEGDTATATCLYCNNGAKVVDLAADLRARASGAKLLDGAKRIEHRVVRSGGAGGPAMVSDHGPGLKLKPGQSARVWMKFTAPQSDKATLIVPGVGAPFESVALSR